MKAAHCRSEMRKKIVFLAFPFFLSFFLLLSCIIPVVYYPGQERLPSSWSKFYKVISLNPGGTISLENYYGDIEILGWDKDEVEVLAEEGRGGYYRGYVRFYGLGSPRLKIDLDKFDNFLKIKTPDLGEMNDVRTIHYFLNVPRSIHLKDIRNKSGDIVISDLYGQINIDQEEGDVKIENYSGSCEISLKSGSVQAEFLDLRKEDEIRITLQEGDMTLFFQPEASFRLEASAPNGNISSEFDLGQLLPAKRISAQTSDGKSILSLTSFNGDIILKKIKGEVP